MVVLAEIRDEGLWVSQSTRSWLEGMNAFVWRTISWGGLNADRLLTMGTLETTIERGSEGNAALLKEVEATLDAEAVSLRFGTIIEERFDAAVRAPRIALFIRLGIVGTVFYNLLLFVDAIIVPDVLYEVIALQLGVATPIAIACIVAIRFFEKDVNYASMITITAMLVCTLATFLLSRSEHVGLYGCFFSLLVLSVNVAQAWAFAWALTFTAITNVAVAAAVLVHPSLDMPTQVFIITLVASASQYSLVGNYRVDASMRRAYLFALRESLRAAVLAETNVRLETLVAVDGLTGIGNRRHFDDVLRNLWKGRGDGRTIALLLIDIDHFKRLNDTHGHLAGDTCLRQVAQTLAERTTRPGLTLARYGGEEFALILAGSGIEDAHTLAEDLRGAIEASTVLAEDGVTPLRVTVSIGCAAILPSSAIDPADLVSAADAALYLAKREGRNRTRSADLQQLRATSIPDRREASGTSLVTAA